MVNIVWFQFDLRINDHLPLFDASSAGSIIPLFIYDEKIWEGNDRSNRHRKFLFESLVDLDNELKKYQISLYVKIGDPLKIFNELLSKYGKYSIYFHHETNINYHRLKVEKIKKWFQNNSIEFYEYQKNAVVAGLKSRNVWSQKWKEIINNEVVSQPKQITGDYLSDNQIIKLEEYFLKEGDFQKGGRSEGLKKLNEFLKSRSRTYQIDISKPQKSVYSSSRLSPYLSFGCLSLREINQNLEKRISQLEDKFWRKSLHSFGNRLKWHCHFIQKLEDEPLIESKNLHPAYDNIRKPEDLNVDTFNSWKEGFTGFPMIDACMRSLIKTGWINFRMRALLMSFHSYNLFNHWKPAADYLATLFLDYEPGIHFSQCQMQSGTTGINTLRVYSSIKQSIDQDPSGEFIKKWVPELKDVSINDIHTPWLSPKKGNYINPIVDEKSSRKRALFEIGQIKKHNDFKKTSKKIYDKHGSRKNTQDQRRRQKEMKLTKSEQLSLF